MESNSGVTTVVATFLISIAATTSNEETELLLHRADQPAIEVFTRGAGAHPDSARMLAGLGTALYAIGSYDEAGLRLCNACDLKPADSNPYLLLGKMEKAAPVPLACSEQNLARFAREQPGSALANYYYAVALWKRERGTKDSEGLRQAETLLEKAVSIDSKLGEAYLQLGIMYSERNSFDHAIGAYQKAIAANSLLSEAHYRLGLAYRRIGNEEQAKQQFSVYERMERNETAAIENQRRAIQQFVVILKEQPATPSPR